MIKAVVLKGCSIREEGYHFIGLYNDERGDVLAVLLDTHCGGMYNVRLVHPSKVELEEAE